VRHEWPASAVPVRKKHFFRPQLDNAALRAGPDSELTSRIARNLHSNPVGSLQDTCSGPEAWTTRMIRILGVFVSISGCIFTQTSELRERLDDADLLLFFQKQNLA
jgi:hypothetical protein